MCPCLDDIGSEEPTALPLMVSMLSSFLKSFLVSFENKTNARKVEMGKQFKKRGKWWILKTYKPIYQLWFLVEYKNILSCQIFIFEKYKYVDH